MSDAAKIASPKARRRCAVYCRVSSDERLDQEFNSIDAQREAGHAYVASQRAEGWIPVADDYDDPGFSGGNTERLGLKRLMADIERGLVDIVVVYKIDRLTRSLADFSKMVEVFERHGVSFVSVTQQFNTTTSMGRLMLNVLLSFAQFEREVTGERIPDKIAASKRKGMWMGGVPPLGYDVDKRLLVINDTEAAVVRRIFEEMLTIGSPTQIAVNLTLEGITTKAWTTTRRPNSAGCAHRQEVHAQAAAQPHLPRGDIAQGQLVPGRAQGHHRSRSVGARSRGAGQGWPHPVGGN
jgi:DNA invertase Pin-like site-specific DNA recombinase